MIELEDVQQGIINLPFRRWVQGNASWAAHGHDLFLRATGQTTETRQAAFAELLEARRAISDDSLITIALSATGLLRFGVNPGLVALLPEEFVEGAHTRGQLLDDPPLQEWDKELREPNWDVLVMHLAPKRAEFNSSRKWIDEICSSASWTHHCQPTTTSARPEPFGVRDGISNPTLRGSGQVLTSGHGVPDPLGKDGWRELAAGEVVFGYPNEEGLFPGATAAREIVANGSFLVWRKIQHHDDAFERLATSVAEQLKLPWEQGKREEVLSTIFGRDSKGVPGGLPTKTNDFTYRNGGTQVLANAHIRRSNPRLGENFAGEPFRALTNGHRILRRGVQYKGGTIFRCYQTNIENQFEFIQREWLNSGERFGQGSLRDPIAGNAPRKEDGNLEDSEGGAFQYGASTDQQVCYQKEVTKVVGSFYGFVPGHRVLDGLARGRWSA